MEQALERRTLAAAELRVDGGEDGPVVEGYASVFNTLSVVIWGFRERVLPGAFADSLANDDVRALWNHDTNYVMGRTSNNTLRLAEDDHGLRSVNYPGSSPMIDSFVVSLRRKDVSQMSFGFVTLEDDWSIDDNDQLIRSLIKVKLYEVSYVAFPAYSATAADVRAAWGNKIEVPAGLSGATGSAAAADVAMRAQAARRKRLLQIESVR